MKKSSSSSSSSSSKAKAKAKAASTLRGAGRHLLKSDKFIFTFLRSAASSQAASWVDMGTSIGLVALGMSAWAATPIGAVAGGVINCCINYKFTFRAQGCSVKAVAVKYLLVWLGSLTLNTVGTSLLAGVLDRWHLLETWGFTDVGSYAAARVVVSLLVSWFWNFLLQRNFVYRPRPHFDPLAVRLVNRLLPRFKNKDN